MTNTDRRSFSDQMTGRPRYDTEKTDDFIEQQQYLDRLGFLPLNCPRPLGSLHLQRRPRGCPFAPLFREHVSNRRERSIRQVWIVWIVGAPVEVQKPIDLTIRARNSA